MTSPDVAARPAKTLSPSLFAVTVFTSAALVFMVQPMAAKLLLPLLGGSPSVWNTSLAFFQTALLAGYGYAHLLQRVRSIRIQALVHCLALAAAALVLPLQVSQAFGPPTSEHPALWLLGVLTVSLGAPFAVLSATAPLVQAWHARVIGSETGEEPYVLYAASNLGSLLALLAYPILIEPLARLHDQTLGWSLGYGAFVLILASLAILVARSGGRQAAAATVEATAEAAAARPAWRTRLAWVLLAAIPSSLMMGVTTHLTTDVASAPFLWVLPLSLYLVTFIIAFQNKPAISFEVTLLFQAAAVAACAVILPFRVTGFLLQLVVHLSAFFFTALMCHQTLVAKRPSPAHLTEFYLFMSLGGVVGGGFNAFLAPVIFNNVWEYPLVLALACLARPAFSGSRVELWRWIVFVPGVVMAVAAPVWGAPLPIWQGADHALWVKIMFGFATISAFLVRRHTLMFFGLIVMILVSATVVGDRVDVLKSWRSFFGVVRESQMQDSRLGTVKMLAHGTTLHGAQAQDPRWRCHPMVYYAEETPIGQVFMDVRRRKPAVHVGAVGLGTGAVSAYVRAADSLTFFEIDPLVVRISSDPKHFSYTTECARGRVDYVIGDARLTLANQPKDSFDILLIDAFSSDSVPAHLLTAEAVRGYLQLLKPDGVLILHLSNRHLELRGPAMAVAHAAGGVSLLQRHTGSDSSPQLWESSEDAVIVGRTPAALAPFAADSRWTRGDPTQAQPWTDDYVNLVGALYAQLRERHEWLP
jgi:SAM-dependent methyltransferase